MMTSDYINDVVLVGGACEAWFLTQKRIGQSSPGLVRSRTPKLRELLQDFFGSETLTDRT